MSALSIQSPYPVFTDIDGQPLEAGYIWIGTSNLDPQTNPINVYWDAALTILAPQPIRTIAGYPSNNGTPARLYVSGSYSIRVMNKNGSTVYSAPSPTERFEASMISITDPGGYYSSDNVNGALQEAGSGKIRGNPTQQHFSIGCIPRCTAGVFDILNDSGHEPMNVTSVTQPDAYTIRINYAQTASKINTFIIQQDNELAPYGVDIGGDVGLSYANTRGYSQFCAYASGATVPANNVLFTGDITSSITDNVLSVTHAAAVSGDIPVACPVYTGPGSTMMLGIGYNNTQITAHALSDISGYLRWDGAQWTITLTNTDPVAAAFTIGAPVGGGTVEISHTPGTDYNIQLTAQDGTYRVANTNIGLGTFEVAFINPLTNAIVTTPDTNMKVFFRRKILCKSTYPSGSGVLMRRGNVPVESARFSNVPGNNFWVYGDMKI